MKTNLTQHASLAAAWLITLTTGFAADDVIFGGLGTDFLLAYDANSHLLVVLGDERDNCIEVRPSDDGSVLVNGRRVQMTWKEPPTVALLGGAGNDVLMGYRLPVVALCGADGDDILVFDNCGAYRDAQVELGQDDLKELVAEVEREYSRLGEFYLSDEYDPRRTAQLDILIRDRDGNVDAVFGDLGNDWIVGGTGKDDAIGGWGGDWISGGTGIDASYGGWGNDLLNADDVLGATR